MLRFLGARLVVLIPTFLGVAFIAFILIRLIPGDPILMMVGERGMTEERHAALMAQYGFDRPAIVQYGQFLGDLARGDFGTSINTREPVLKEFFTRFPATVELSTVAMLLALLVGLPAGIIAAVKRGSMFDHTLMGISLTGFSMPIFWWGLLLIILFSGILGWTPVSGRISMMYFVEPTTGFMLLDALLSDEKGAFWSAASHLILPSIVLGTVPLAVIARQTRSAMLEVLGEDYVRTARAKGLPPGRVIGLHALRNALIPVVTVIGLLIGSLFGGAILTETIFAWPGVGKWLVDSIARRDYPSVQGGIVLIASIVMLVNLGIDLLYGLINPRIRHGELTMADRAAALSDPLAVSLPPSRLAEFWHYFSENKGAVAGLAVIGLVILAAILAGVIAPHDPTAQNRDAFLQPPAWIAGGSWSYPLGTDAVGRDIYSRILYGARFSLLIGAIVITLSLSVGVVMGLIAGFARGWVETMIMRLMDIILALPSLLLAIVIVAILGPGLVNAMISVAVTYLPQFTRLTRASVITELSKEYVTASRVSGAGTLRLMFKTVLPNCWAPLIVQATLGFSNAILDAAALGFLGLGAQPPTPEWGSMLADAREFVLRAWWVVTFPGLAILITVLAFNLAGDGLRDALDPKLKRS